jgi:uncharacterized membrane protein
METLTIIFSTVSAILSVLSMIIGIIALIELRSFMKSTHKVEFVPLDHNATAGKEPGMDDELKKYGLMD